MSRVMSRRPAGMLAAVGLASGALVLGAVPANADVERRGTCSAGSSWDVDIERERGVFDIDVEVQSQTSGENWQLVVTQNGKRVFSSTLPSRQDSDDRYADVDWIFTAKNTPRVRDRFRLVATNQTTGEVCRVMVSA